MSGVSPLLTVTRTRSCAGERRGRIGVSRERRRAELGARRPSRSAIASPIWPDSVDDAGPGQQRDRPAGQRQAAAGIAADAAGAGYRDRGRAVEHLTSCGPSVAPCPHDRRSASTAAKVAGKPSLQMMPAIADCRRGVTRLALSTIPRGHETAYRSRRKPRRPDPLPFRDARRRRRAGRAGGDAEAARLFGRAAGLFGGRHARHREPLRAPFRQRHRI